MSGRIGAMGVWMHGCMDAWVHGMHGCMHAWMHGYKHTKGARADEGLEAWGHGGMDQRDW